MYVNIPTYQMSFLTCLLFCFFLSLYCISLPYCDYIIRATFVNGLCCMYLSTTTVCMYVRVSVWMVDGYTPIYPSFLF